VEVVEGDLTDPAVLSDLRGTVDVVLCNPPYVPDGTVVPPEVARYDPAEAVFGGPDGLAVIRPVVALAANLLKHGGVVGIEHDDGHAAAVPGLLRADGRFSDVARTPRPVRTGPVCDGPPHLKGSSERMADFSRDAVRLPDRRRP
jgi:release factor glutamine methyltransferase